MTMLSQKRGAKPALTTGEITAALGVTVLRELLKFGCLRGRVFIYVAEGIPTLYRNRQRAEIIWSVEKVSGFRRTYVDQSRVIVAIGERIAKQGVN